MQNNPDFKKTDSSKIVFMLSIGVSIFWILGNVFNIYKSAIVGAIFEIIWLPVIVLTGAILVISVVKWAREKFDIRSLYLYSFLIIVLVLVIIQI